MYKFSQILSVVGKWGWDFYVPPIITLLMYSGKFEK